jgi:hypothetical protein
MDQSGSCLCGAVRFSTRGRLRPVINCHCTMCRRWHGHFGAYTGTTLDNFTLLEDRGLKWYRSSEIADRGFCGECGSSLFWRKRDAGAIGIAAGALDTPTGLHTKRHEFVADQSDYYQLNDDLEKRPAD